MTENVLTTRQGALWVQPNGPNTAVHFLGCHDLGDISEPLGAVDILRCMDKKGGWKTVGSTQAPPDVVTTSIDSLTFGVRDWLEKLSCEFTLFALQRECGEPDIFTNYVRVIALDHARVTSMTDKQIVHHLDDQSSMQSRDISAWPPVIRTGELTARRQTTSETKDLNDVFAYTPIDCDNPCPVPGETALAVSDTSMYDEDVLRTLNGGVNWDVLAGEPFSAGENVISCVAFPISNTVTRLVVAQIAVSTTFGRIAYSDDDGATWTEVVFQINGHGAASSGSLFALDQSHVWLGSAKGYIYFSSDGGATWTAQTAGTLTIKDVKSVFFSDENNGMAGCADDILLITSDGGATWELTDSVTGTDGDVNAVTKSGKFWWAGTDTGQMFYSSDDGDTWTERNIPIASGSIAGIAWGNELIGYAIHNTAASVGSILVTINGGYSWKAITTPLNSGLNALDVSDLNTVYAVGNVNGGTAVIVKVTWD